MDYRAFGAPAVKLAAFEFVHDCSDLARAALFLSH
jgi:hypothetical protein